MGASSVFLCSAESVTLRLLFSTPAPAEMNIYDFFLPRDDDDDDELPQQGVTGISGTRQ